MKRKRCPLCGRSRWITSFYPCKAAKDGHQRLCKDCDNQDRKRRYNQPVSRDAPWRPRLVRKICPVCNNLGHARPPEGCPGCKRPPTLDG
jgi:hypothetical protein